MNTKQNQKQETKTIKWIESTLRKRIKSQPTCEEFVNYCLDSIKEISPFKIAKNLTLYQNIKLLQEKCLYLGVNQKYLFDSTLLLRFSTLRPLILLMNNLIKQLKTKKNIINKNFLHKQNHDKKKIAKTNLQKIKNYYIEGFVEFNFQYLSENGHKSQCTLELNKTYFVFATKGNEVNFKWEYKDIEDYKLGISKPNPHRFVLKVKDNSKEKNFLLFSKSVDQRDLIIKTFQMFKYYCDEDNFKNIVINGDILGYYQEITLYTKRLVSKEIINLDLIIKSKNKSKSSTNTGTNTNTNTNTKTKTRNKENNLKKNVIIQFEKKCFFFKILDTKKNPPIYYWSQNEINIKLKETNNRVKLLINNYEEIKQFNLYCINKDFTNILFNLFQEFKQINNGNVKANKHINGKKNFNSYDRRNPIKDLNKDNLQNTNYPTIIGHNEYNNQIFPLKSVRVRTIEDSPVSIIQIYPKIKQDQFEEENEEFNHSQIRYFTTFDYNGIGTVFQNTRLYPYSFKNHSVSLLNHTETSKHSQVINGVINGKSKSTHSNINNNNINSHRKNHIYTKIKEYLHEGRAIFKVNLIYPHYQFTNKNRNTTTTNNKTTTNVNSKDIPLFKTEPVQIILNKETISINPMKEKSKIQPFIEAYNKYQKLFLNVNKKNILLFISNQSEQKYLLQTNNLILCDLIANCYHIFSQNHQFSIFKASNKFPIQEIISPLHNNNYINKNIDLTNSVYEYIKNPKNKNDKGMVLTYIVQLYNSLEDYVGDAKIILFNNYFSIQFQNLEFNRYYSKYSKIFKYDNYNKNYFNKQNLSKFCRLNIDENIYIIFNFKMVKIKSQFIKNFNSKKDKLLKICELKHPMYFESIIASPNRGNFICKITLYRDKYYINTPISNIYGEYLIGTRVKLLNKKKSLRSIKLDLGTGHGLLQLSFANSVQAKDFINNFNFFKNRYIAISNYYLIKKFNNVKLSSSCLPKAPLPLLKILNNEQYNDEDSSNKKKRKSKPKTKKKILISNSRLLFLNYHKNTKKLINSQIYNLQNSKLFSIKDKKKLVHIKLSNKAKEKLIIKFKSRLIKENFILNYNLITSRKNQQFIKKIFYNKNSNNNKNIKENVDSFNIRKETEKNPEEVEEKEKYNGKNTDLFNSLIKIYHVEDWKTPQKLGYMQLFQNKIKIQLFDGMIIQQNLQKIKFQLFPLSNYYLELKFQFQLQTFLISFPSIYIKTHFLLLVGSLKKEKLLSHRIVGIYFPGILRQINDKDLKKKERFAMKLDKNKLKFVGLNLLFELNYENLAIERNNKNKNQCYLYQVVNKNKKKLTIEFMDQKLSKEFCHVFNYRAFNRSRENRIKFRNENSQTIIMNENKPTKYTKHEKHEKHKLYDSELMKKRGKGKEYNKIREKMEYTNNTFQINFLTPEQKVISNGFIQIKPRNLEISLYGYNDQQKAIRFNDLDFVQISQYKHFKDILSLKYFNMVFYCKFSSLDRVQEFSFLFFTIIRKIIESQETIWKYRLKIIKGFEYTKSSPSSSLSSSKPNKKSDDENKYKVKEKDNSKGKGKIKGKKNINNNNNVEKKKKGEKGNNENPRKLLDLNTNKLFFNTNCPPFETTDFPILVYSPKIKQKN
ncbi:hypothetical protein M0813_15368 [Anaeramoeba flamelloides]|uniref:Uncharacterized protein n=1 Tax=Anaeramoeba flamelloides TaxID=1746091 RepID=A0ABQ8Z176_9EUKA|nr:hypothetical protein M0813_15368 [Anaeramoeba flamelloides]